MRLTARPAFAALLCLLLAGFVNADGVGSLSGSWTSGAAAPSYAHAAAASLPDGRVLIAGGDGATGPVAACEIVDVEAVVAAAAMTTPRSGHAAVALQDGRVLVTGGVIASDGTTTNSAEIYDPAQDVWRQLPAAMTEPRARHTATRLTDGRVLLAGGDNQGTVAASLELFDPATEAFTPAGTMSSPRTQHAAASLADGRVLLAGGFDGNVELASVDLVDPAAAPLLVSPAMPLAVPRAELTATAMLDGTVLLAGGRSSGHDVAVTEIVDPVSGVVSAAAPLNQPRRAHAAILLPNNNGVLVIGGMANDAPTASAEIFMPWAGATVATGSTTVPHAPALASTLPIEGLALAAGGAGAGNADVYHFATITTDGADYQPGTTVTIVGRGWQPGETVTLTFVESPSIDTPSAISVVADGNGTFVNSDFAPDQHDVGIRFYLTATGAASQAQTTFTDGPGANVHFSTTGLPSGTPVNVSYAGTNNGGKPANGIVTFNAPGPSSDVSADPASSFSYTLPASVVAATGTYTLSSATPSSPLTTGAARSTTAVVAAYDLICATPTVTLQPLPQTTNYGGASVTFTAAGAGNPVPTVQWEANTGAGFSAVPGATSTTLTIAAPTVAMTGSYRAVFTNTCRGTTASETSNAASLTVNAAPLTITARDASMVYGTPLPSFSAKYDGFVKGENANNAVTVPPTITTTATSASHVADGPYPITAAGAVAPNYAITYVAGELTITPAPLTITADDQTKPYGAVLPTLTVTYSGLVNGDTPSTFAAPPNAPPEAATSATAASHVTGSPYSITVSGASDADYRITYASGRLTITPGTLTVKVNDQTKTYGAALPPLTASYSGFANGDTAASLTSAVTLTTAATAASHVAGSPYAITAGGAVDPDYAISYVPGALTVTPAPLTITADDKTKAYGAALPALTASYSGLVNGDTPATFAAPPNAAPVVATVATAASHVAGGPYAITASGAIDTDYAIGYADGALAITPVALTIKADDQTRVYGTPNSALTVSYAGLVNGDTAATFGSAPNVAPTVATSALAGSHVSGSPYDITPSGAVDADYAISYAPGKLTITPAPLTITADDKTKVYGAALPALTVSYTGFVNGDTPSTLATAPNARPTVTTAATAGSGVLGSPYAITPSGAVDPDYSIGYVGGALTITPAPLTITANDQTMLYGGAVPTLTASYTGLVNGDTIASFTPPATVATSATSSSGVGTYAITASGAVDSNYAIAYVAGTLKISYNMCLLYDPAKPARSGSTIPLKIQLCSAFGADASTSATAVAARQLTLLSTATSELAPDSGNANPDGNFRFDVTLGPGYIFNLQTKGLGSGTYQLEVWATDDPSPHLLTFQVK